MRWSEVSFAALDFETTGLDPSRDEIISFATIPVEGGRVRLADSRYRLVRPARMPDGDSIRIHGLRPADLEDAPPLDEVLDELLAAITGRVRDRPRRRGRARLPVARRWSGTGWSCATRSWTRPRSPPSCGAATGRFASGGRPTGLTELARAFRLPVHRPHHADGDALTTAQLFLALATHLDRAEPLTLGAMQELRHAQPGPLARRSTAAGRRAT